ncbi:MAG: hypothetical protein AAB514_03525 [Patescibacteria group bacterium]
MGKEKQLKYHQELIFLIAAILMLIVLIISVSWLLGFLVERLNIVLNPNVLEAPAVTHFNIEEFKKLNLIKIP